jgi:predicted unusual protein kinase regulating ubiquinone biosynthesis (AarF/ABC1/UbiB family)
MDADSRTPSPAMPTGPASRAARVARTGAGIAGRSAAARLRRIGADPARREAIDAEAQAASALALFDTLADLRGPAMKLGQMLAQHGYALPEAYVQRLADLQWSAPPMHGTLARIQFKQALGRYPEEVFARFERVPFAAASLGQVHRAWLADGTPLAVKIQYPGIERAIASDFALVEHAVGAARIGGRHAADVRAAIAELRSHVLAEVDYELEAAAMMELRAGLADRGDLVIPRAYRDLSGTRVLTMDFLEGVHIRDYLAAGPSRAERDAVASRLLDLFFRQALGLGLLHADPHPGNFLFQAEGRIGLVDFGCVKRFDPGFTEQLRALYRIPPGDTVALDRQYRTLGFYDLSMPDVDARRATLLGLQALNGAKFHEDRLFDFGDGEHLRALTACMQAMVRQGLAHRDFVLYMRTKLGLFGLFYQLAARVNCHRVLASHI